MRLIDRKRLIQTGIQYPQAKTPLQDWYTIMKQVKAANLMELRKPMPMWIKWARPRCSISKETTID